MIKSIRSRIVLSAALFGLAATSLLAPMSAAAREGNAVGGGVKCYWVLTSSVNGVNTYTQVCRKGV